MLFRQKSNQAASNLEVKRPHSAHAKAPALSGFTSAVRSVPGTVGFPILAVSCLRPTHPDSTKDANDRPSNACLDHSGDFEGADQLRNCMSPFGAIPC